MSRPPVSFALLALGAFLLATFGGDVASSVLVAHKAFGTALADHVLVFYLGSGILGTGVIALPFAILGTSASYSSQKVGRSRAVWYFGIWATVLVLLLATAFFVSAAASENGAYTGAAMEIALAMLITNILAILSAIGGRALVWKVHR